MYTRKTSFSSSTLRRNGSLFEGTSWCHQLLDYDTHTIVGCIGPHIKCKTMLMETIHKHLQQGEKKVINLYSIVEFESALLARIKESEHHSQVWCVAMEEESNRLSWSIRKVLSQGANERLKLSIVLFSNQNYSQAWFDYLIS
jgi:hypothetical protein